MYHLVSLTCIHIRETVTTVKIINIPSSPQEGRCVSCHDFASGFDGFLLPWQDKSQLISRAHGEGLLEGQGGRGRSCRERKSTGDLSEWRLTMKSCCTIVSEGRVDAEHRAGNERYLSEHSRHRPWSLSCRLGRTRAFITPGRSQGRVG